MGASNPSRLRGKPAAAKAAGATLTYQVTLTARDGASPFDGERGRRVAEAWKTLGEGRPWLETDAFALGPRTLQGILRVKPGHPEAITLPGAVRLFKLLSARALAQDGDGERGSGGLWKQGFAERPLTTLKQVVDARAALKKS